VPRRTRQLSLDLRTTPTWGGRRDNAGRKRGPHPRDPHRRRAPFNSSYPCHVTLKLRCGLPSLRIARFVRAFEATLRATHARSNRFRVIHYSIQRDHLHLIVEATNARQLACGMKAIGARLARAVHRVFALRGGILADRFHLHVLRTPREVRNAIAYVLLNARRHLAKGGGRIDPHPRVDPASSGRWFDGWRGGVSIGFGPRDAPAILRARTWLLHVGWRRHGLVEATEVPGMS
jgi:REP element-mobilizing transposase RayT